MVQLRPKQWIKNLVVLGGLVFSGRLADPAAQLAAALAFAAFCLVSSAVYILNDLLDIQKDRLNPRTARRPLPAGDISIGTALLLMVACLAGAGTISAGMPIACGVILGTYALQNVLYSIRLKREAIADVLSIALGFVMRLVFGILAVQARPTAWAILCMLFLALFLGFAKRRGELGDATPAEASLARPVLGQYNAVFLELLLAMAAAMTVMCYAVFTVTGGHDPTLAVTIVPVLYCVLRYLMQVTVHGRGESPEDILLSDKRIWVGVAVWAVLVVAILYGDFRILAERWTPQPK